MDQSRSQRNSNLELIRIISMILIVAYHYAYHGFILEEMSSPANQYPIVILTLGGKLGVSCFVLLSAYFMCQSRFTGKKLFRLWGSVWFYSLVFYGLFISVLKPVYPLRINDLVAAIFPVGTDSYWFITDYVILMVVSPVLNAAIAHLDRKDYWNFLWIGLVFWSLMPFFVNITYGFTALGWFFYLYFAAGYIRRFSLADRGTPGKFLAAASILFLVLILSGVILLFLGQRLQVPALIRYSRHCAVINSPLVLFISVFLLLGLLKLKPRHSRFINGIAGTTLGVYLIHDHTIVRPYLWEKILNCSQMADSPWLILHALLSIAAVFTVCALIDLIRQNTAEKLWLRFSDRIFSGK